MDEKLKRHQFVHVTSVEEEEEEIDDKTFINGDCANDNDNSSDSVPLGLSGKAVCIQVCIPLFSVSLFLFCLKCKCHCSQAEHSSISFRSNKLIFLHSKSKRSRLKWGKKLQGKRKRERVELKSFYFALIKVWVLHKCDLANPLATIDRRAFQRY